MTADESAEEEDERQGQSPPSEGLEVLVGMKDDLLDSDGVEQDSTDDREVKPSKAPRPASFATSPPRSGA